MSSEHAQACCSIAEHIIRTTSLQLILHMNLILILLCKTTVYILREEMNMCIKSQLS